MPRASPARHVQRAESEADMERMDMERCYACGVRIGFLRSLLRPLEATFESAFDGRVRAAFCSVSCRQSAQANAATVHAIGLGEGGDTASVPMAEEPGSVVDPKRSA